MPVEDNMIMDVLVGDSIHEAGKVTIKFLAIAGGCGPELTMPISLAVQLNQLLTEYLLGTGDAGIGREQVAKMIKFLSDKTGYTHGEIARIAAADADRL